MIRQPTQLGRRDAIKWLVVASMVVAACGGDTNKTSPPVSATLSGELSLELRDTAAVTVEPDPSDPTRATIIVTPSAHFGLLGEEAALQARGRIDALPEANSTLYSAKFEIPAQTGDAPCGSEPISLALTLHRQGQNAMVVGGLTAYCGAGRWFAPPGEAPIRVLRLAGELPLGDLPLE
jgi:hypothetical protein